MNRSSLAVGLLVLGVTIATRAIAAEPTESAQSSTSAATTKNTTGDNWIDPPSASPPTEKGATPAPKPQSTAAAPGATSTRFVSPQPAPSASTAAQSTTATTSASAPNVNGQWVYTEQYGWIWMPHDRAYTYLAPEGNPYMYIYYPAAGWCWLYAPWVVGWGPMPYWGVHGPVRFAWYSRPWFQRPVGWGVHYGGYWGGYWHGGYGHGGYGHGGYGHGAYHPGWHGGGFHHSPGLGGGHRVPAFGGGRGHR